MKQLVILLLLLSQVVKAQEEQKLSLFDSYKLARENHPYFQDKQRISDNADLKLKNTSIQWLPQLNVNAQATYQSEAISLDLPVPLIQAGKLEGMTSKHIETDKDQYKAYLDVNQMLYDGGSVKAQRKITESSTQAEMLQNESELHKINEQVNQVYFNILILKENIKLLENVKINLLQRQKTIEASLKNGILQQSDLDNIKIEVLRNQQQIDELQIGLSSGIANLSELTGKALNDSVQVEIPDVVIADTGSFQRADLKAFDAQKTSLKFSDNLSHSQRLPRMYAFAQGGYGKPALNMLSTSFEDYYIVGVNLKWNIWDWNKTARDRKSLTIQSEMLDSRRQAIEKNLRISLTNSKSRIDQLQKALLTDNSIVDLRLAVTKRSETKLEQGVITATDYINDLNAETQSKIQLQTHVVQLAQEKVNYLTIKGML